MGVSTSMSVSSCLLGLLVKGMIVRLSTFVMMVMVMIVVVIVMSSSQMVVSLTLMQDFHLNKVEKESHNCGDPHFFTLYLLWGNDPVDGLEQKPHSESKQEDN